MASISLRVDPDLCGPVSVGTVGLIRLLAEHCELSLPDATEWVNRCVFDGEVVSVPAPTAEAAEHFAAAVAVLRSPASFSVRVER